MELHIAHIQDSRVLHKENWFTKIEKKIYLFYKYDNHSVGDFLLLYWLISMGILFLLFVAELYF